MEEIGTNLMLRFQNGDETAFREIVEQYKLSVLNLCYRFVNNKEDAEDLAQDVFIRILKAAPRYKPDASLSTWIYRITVNVCLNFQRRKKILNFFSLNHQYESGQTAEDRLPELVSEEQPETNLEKKELQIIIQNAIQSLPENQQTVVILHRYEGHSYQEIADVLDTTVSAVESRLHRAKLNLKKKLKGLKKYV